MVRFQICEVKTSLSKLRQKGTDRLRQDTRRVQKAGDVQHSRQRQGKNKRPGSPCLGASKESKEPQHHRHGGGPDEEAGGRGHV